MKLLNRQESEAKITQYAREGRPFLFAINFPATGAFVMTPEEARENKFFLISIELQIILKRMSVSATSLLPERR